MTKTQKKALLRLVSFGPLLLAMGLLALIVQLPQELRLKMGRALGTLGFYGFPSFRKLVRVNLALCFPHLSESERKALEKSSLQSLGMGLIEAGMAWFLPKSRLTSLITFQGKHHLDKALQQNRGVLLLGAHLTTMELAGRLCTLHFPLNALYQKARHPLLDRLILNRRQRYYQNIIIHSDIRTTLRCLKRGEVVWFAPDQEPSSKHRIFAKFFDQNTASSTATVSLAKLTRCSVVPVAYYRKPDNAGYEIVFFPPLKDFPSDHLEKDVLLTNQTFESMIRKHPEQYLWAYQRFKHTPEGRVFLYD